MKINSNEQRSSALARLRRLSLTGLSIFLAFVFLWVGFDTLLASRQSNIYGVSHPEIALAAGEPAPLQQAAQDLAIAKSHTGNFQIGTQGTYFVTVTNVGTGQVNGSVVVNDTLPNGLAPVQASGPGWTGCGISGQIVSCSHQNLSGLPPGSSLGTISIVVNVGQAAAPSVTNVATLVNENDTNTAQQLGE